MIRLLWLICLCFISFVVSAEFIGGTDIPLMDGMQTDESESFSFDAPEGQLVEFTAKIDKTPKEVRSFYQTTLNELGWQKKSATRYVREQDELVLQIRPHKQGSVVKIQYTFANK